MAKAKILGDKVVIESKVLTDENIRKASIISPASLEFKEEDKVLYAVTTDKIAMFNEFGASFKDGKTEANIPDSSEILKVKVEAALMKINFIESYVSEVLAATKDMKLDITEC